jgi:hypothetical protein
MVELQRPSVIVRVAIAARIPRSGGETLREELDLTAPVVAVAADAVQEQDERALAGYGDGDARRRADEDAFQGYSAFAPEILTARPRLSRSVLMKVANSCGELPTTS